MKRNTLLVGLVLVVLAVAAYYYWQTSNRAVAADVGREATVRRGTLLSTVRASGSIEAEAQLALNFGAPGTVAEVNVQVGQQVKEGDVLARLDTAELELAVAQAEKTYLIQQANYSLTLAGPKPEEVAAAQAQLSSAWAQYNDLKQPKTDQVAQAEAQLLQARVQYDTAREAHEKTLACYRVPRPDGTEEEVCPLLGPTEERARQQAELAKASYDAAQATYDRVVKGASDAQRSAAWAQVQQAQANLARLQPDENRITIARLQMEQARLSLEQARQRLKNAVIVAPFDGIVAEVNIRRGASVATGALKPAIILADLSKFHITVNVDEIDVGRLKVNQPVSVTVDALPGAVIQGRVDYIAPVATIEGAVVSYKVLIALAPTDEPLRAGMSANISIVTESRPNVLLVPNWAIRIDRATGKTYVNLKQGDTIREIEIITGARNESESEVIAGLSEGDHVVSGGIQKLSSILESMSNQ